MITAMRKTKRSRSIKKTNNPGLEDLLILVKILRRKCPWDRSQTLQSFKNNAIEEAYEFAEAVDENDREKLQEEIGDLLFVAMFAALICQQQRGIRIRSMIAGTIRKYRKKHPHVFRDKKLKNAEAVLEFWQRSKKDIFKGIPRSLPSMHAARIIQERAAKLGFDWPEAYGPLKKIYEELSELKTSTTRKKIMEEFGDLLFACVNYARHIKIDPERSLKKANEKFVGRFRGVLGRLRRRGKDPDKVNLREMDRIWDEIKRPYRAGRKNIKRNR